ncbi:MAG: lipocalin-like domain-containing protein, partial [Myxococcales bacterium]
MSPASASRKATTDSPNGLRGGEGTWQRRRGGDGAAALVVFALVVVAINVAGSGCSSAPPSSDRAPAAGGLTVTSLLGGATEGGEEGREAVGGTDVAEFARANAPRPFTFPADHGPHPAFRTEWWYFTGIVRGRSAGGSPRRFGYQFTIFRQALTADRPSRDSAWATREVYMAHLGISDLDGDPARPRFHAFQRFSRDGLALAGAQVSPFAVWVDSWRMESTRRQAPPLDDIFPLRLRARESPAPHDAALSPDPTGAAIDFSVGAGRGPVLQGDHGWSVKGAGAGNASFYYSCTRLPTRGRLTIGTEIIDVEGTSWLDREWSTSALAPDVVGWDWAGAHLDDGRDLMFYRLRTRSGGVAPASRVTLIDPDGGTRTFAPDAFALIANGQWSSPDGNAHYPAAFRLQIPAAAVDLTLRPMLSDQELRLAVRYWEGAVA